MGYFIADYENSIDAKNRLSIPSSYRKILSEDGSEGNVCVFPSHYSNPKGKNYPCLEVLSINQFTRMADKAHSPEGCEEDENQLHEWYGCFKELCIDGNGRITLPPILCDHAQLSNEAFIWARGPMFEIWNPKQREAKIANKDAKIEPLREFEQRVRRRGERARPQAIEKETKT